METFTKEEILTSVRYKAERDLVRVLLADGEAYALETVDKLLEEFKKGKV